ncbi:MAG: hypothetical protein K2Q26_01760 [Bdellovibrionales bacterium]|nr:hypothetical protein [Bdellovibrionales bacterium]
MMKIHYKNLEKSELANSAVSDRLLPVCEKFPLLAPKDLSVTLEMQNSPRQSGPDVFRVTLYIPRGRYSGVKIVKADANLYRALALISDLLLEKLNNIRDKDRVKSRAKARKVSRRSVPDLDLTS